MSKNFINFWGFAMNKNWVASAAAAALFAFGASGAGAATVFTDNATDFHGEYRGVSDLDVGVLSAGGSNAISFDLFGTNSLDGYGNGWDDVFDIFVNSVKVFSGSFNMSGGGSNAVFQNDLGWAWSTVTNPGGNFQGGVTSISGLVDLNAGNNTIRFSFSAPGPNNGSGQSLGDESWALNTLDVTPTAVPLPAALPLLAVAIAGLGMAGRRRRKSTAA